MKPSETKRLYERACRQRRISPRGENAQAELELWHRKLRGYDVRDVEAALDAWDEDRTPDEQGQPRGKWLPKPAELIPLIIHEAKTREAQQQGPKDFIAWRCSGCKHSMASFVPKGESAARACPCCNASMTEFMRGAA